MLLIARDREGCFEAVDEIRVTCKTEEEGNKVC
jgi:hypothetical protein